MRSATARKKKAAPSAATLKAARRDMEMTPQIPAPILSDNCGGFKYMNKKEYIKLINDLLEKSNDLTLLDLIYKILARSV